MYEVGSISTGTLRAEDLLPAFVDSLPEDSVVRDRFDGLCKIESLAMDHGFDEEASFEEWMDNVRCTLVQEAEEELNENAPPGFYFGAHPGNGADFGFWLMDEPEAREALAELEKKANEVAEALRVWRSVPQEVQSLFDNAIEERLRVQIEEVNWLRDVVREVYGDSEEERIDNTPRQEWPQFPGAWKREQERRSAPFLHSLFERQLMPELVSHEFGRWLANELRGEYRTSEVSQWHFQINLPNTAVLSVGWSSGHYSSSRNEGEKDGVKTAECAAFWRSSRGIFWVRFPWMTDDVEGYQTTAQITEFARKVAVEVRPSSLETREVDEH